MTKITRRNARHMPNRRSQLLLAATYGLTSSLIAPTLNAAHRSAPKNGLGINIYCVQSALPFFSDRCVQVKSNAREPATSALVADPNQLPTTPSGDTK